MTRSTRRNCAWRKHVRSSICATALVVLAGCAAQNPEPGSEAGSPVAQTAPSQIEIAPNRPIEWSQRPDTASAPPVERPPNIVFILLDDLGINDLSTFGGGVAGGRVPTTHIDRLAAEGANFTQAYAGHGTCAPSRAQLMTGRYSTRTGFEYTPTPNQFGSLVTRFGNEMDNGLPDYIINEEAQKSQLDYSEQGLPPSEITIAEILKEKGYHTVHIGKWHLGTTAKFHPNAQGFDESLLMHGQLFLPEDHADVVNAKLSFDPIDKTLWTIGRFSTSFNGSKLFEPGGYLTDYWTEESLKVIEANRNRPFFLYLAHWGVHTPLQATKEDYEAVGDIEPHRLRVYAAMLRAVDRSVGKIMAKLEEEGLSENTIIVLSSDNGGAGYVGLPEVNAPYRGWKITLFEGGIRAPLFIKWPGRIEPGKVIDKPVAHIDVMPTLAAAAAAPLPHGVPIDGHNLLPLAMGSGDIARENDALFWNSGHYKAVRAGDWKLQINDRISTDWLFNLAEDPTEQVNLASARPDKVAELRAMLDEHHRDRTPPLYASTRETPVMIDKTLVDRFEDGDEYIYWPN